MPSLVMRHGARLDSMGSPDWRASAPYQCGVKQKMACSLRGCCIAYTRIASRAAEVVGALLIKRRRSSS